MDDRLDRMRATLESLAIALSRLEERVTELEEVEAWATAQAVASYPDTAPGVSPGGRSAEKGRPLVRVLSLIGMFFLVLAGAFLLRSFTDAETLSTASGVALGLLYSLGWIVFADRAGARGSTLAASLIGVAAVLIAYPLLWEATTKPQPISSLEVLTPELGATLLTIFTCAAMSTAWLRGLRALVWAVTIATIASATVLLVTTTAVEAFTVPVLVLGVLTLWLAYERGWQYARWPAAVAADGFILLMVHLAGRDPEHLGRFDHFSLPFVQLLALVLLLTYLSSFILHSLLRRRRISAFELLQTLGVLLIGFGGAVHVAGSEGPGGLVLGAAALVGAGGCYAVAFTFIDRQLGRGNIFFYYAWLALALALLGSWQVFHPTVLVYFLSLLATAAAYLGGHFDRITLRAHCAVTCAVVAWQSGSIGFSIAAFATPTLPDWNASIPVVLAFLVVCYALLVTTQSTRRARWLERVPRLVVLVLWVIGAGGMLVLLTSTFLPEQDPALLAVIRTGVLSVAAIALAAGSRRKQLVEMSWLLYPVLGIGGLKLLVEDLRHGDPVTIFIAFTCYGCALIIAPRLQRKAPTVAG